jgi:hypothetical protein
MDETISKVPTSSSSSPSELAAVESDKGWGSGTGISVDGGFACALSVAMRVSGEQRSGPCPPRNDGMEVMSTSGARIFMASLEIAIWKNVQQQLEKNLMVRATFGETDLGEGTGRQKYFDETPNDRKHSIRVNNEYLIGGG